MFARELDTIDIIGGGLMEVGIYGRQSVDKKDSISIEAQIDFCRKECNPDDHFFIYTDKGFSGKNMKRPEFQRMLEDVKNGKIQRVVVYRLDRLSRSIVDFAQIWDTLNACHVSFTSVSEKFDTESPVGRAMIYIIMIFAQLERETISERVKDNYYERTKYGSWLGGPAPYGFDNGRITAPDGRNIPTLVHNESMEIVERIFMEYAKEGTSLGSVAKALTAEKIPSAKRGSWDNVTVSRILHSPVYVCADVDVYTYYKNKGITRFSNDISEYDGTRAAMVIGKRAASTRKYSDFEEHTVALANFEGVIPSNVWLTCQYKLERNKQLKNTGKGKYTWLTGLMKCKACGYAAVVKKEYPRNGETKRYLACSGRSNMRACDVTRFQISIAELEGAAQEELNKVLEQFHGEENNVVNVKDANKKLELARLEDKIEKLIDCMADSTEVTVSYLNKKIAELDEKKQKILKDMEKNQRQSKQKLENIVFSKLDMEQKHLVAEQFIEKILISDDEIEIVWKV